MTNDSSGFELRTRVLIIVRGGVAYSFSDSNVNVLTVDYDNDPDASISEDFVDLLNAPADA